MKVCVFVLVPLDAPFFSVAVDDMMERYNWNRDVKSYQTECWCVQSRARSEVTDRILARLGTIPEVEARLAHLGLDETQDARFRLLREKAGAGAFRESKRLSAKEKEELSDLNEIRMRPAEEAQIVWHSEQRRQWEENPPLLRPDADCEECNGSGFMTTTDNPNGEFESQMLYYDLEVPRYDPALDANLRLPCLQPLEDSCSLKKQREAQPLEVAPGPFFKLRTRYARALRSVEIETRPRPTRCEGCLGDGERLRWARDWKESRQAMLPVSWLDECPIFPYAVVSPDGKWHLLDVVGFNDDSTKRAWDESIAEFNRLLEEHNSCYVGACYVRM